MSRATLRRAKRLKSDAAPAIAAMARKYRDYENSYNVSARDHLLEIIAVCRYGEPRIDEPLADAYKRAKSKFEFNYYALAVSMRLALEKEPPPGDIKTKISTLIQEAPDWLIYFCQANLSMRELGIKPRKIPKSIQKLVPAKSDRFRWPSLPKGVLKSLPDRGEEHLFLDAMSLEELFTFYLTMQTPEEDWTRREHRFVQKMFARKPNKNKSKERKHVALRPDDSMGDSGENIGPASLGPVDTHKV